jgi:hypothetical protein
MTNTTPQKIFEGPTTTRIHPFFTDSISTYRPFWPQVSLWPPQSEEKQLQNLKLLFIKGKQHLPAA